MKKILSLCIGFIIALSFFVVPTQDVMAGNGLITDIDNPENIELSTSYDGSLRLGIRTIVNYFLYFLGLISVVMVIYGGFLYVSSGGEDTEKAKKVLMYAAIGIIVVLISFALVNTLLGAGMAGGEGEL